MVNRHAKCLFQLSFPGREGLILPCIDKIETDPIELFARDIERDHRLGGGVYATESLKVLIVKCLDSHGNPAHACFSIGFEATRLNGPRIGFKGNFQIIGARPVLSDPVQNTMNHIRVHQAGRPTTKEDRGQNAALRQFGIAVDFGQIGAEPAGLINLPGDVTIEIAIGAFGLTEGPVQIDGEAALLPIFSQNSQQPVF